MIEASIEVLNQPFIANGNVATAGGCVSSQYLACWVIAKIAGQQATEAAIHYVAPVGEKEETVNRCIAVVKPFIGINAV